MYVQQRNMILLRACFRHLLVTGSSDDFRGWYHNDSTVLPSGELTQLLNYHHVYRSNHLYMDIEHN